MSELIGKISVTLIDERAEGEVKIPLDLSAADTMPDNVAAVMFMDSEDGIVRDMVKCSRCQNATEVDLSEHDPDGIEAYLCEDCAAVLLDENEG